MSTARRRPRRGVTLLAACLAAALAGAVAGGVAVRAASPQASGSEPYRRGGQDTLEFRGAGRDEPEPDVPDVVLGWFGPGDPDHPAFGTLWRGATLALEEQNANGGYRGAPGSPRASLPGKRFRLEPAWSESPWQAGIGTLLRLVYEQHAWAVIGGVDGSTTHLALQVALKSHFLLLSPASSDVSTDRANVPWLFSLAPSDEACAAVVVAALVAADPIGSVAIAASAEHEGHAALAAFRRELARRQRTPSALVEYEAGSADLDAAARRLLASGPHVVLVLGPGRAAGAFVAALRRSGFSGSVYGSTTASGHAFQVAAGDAVEGVFAPATSGGGAAWSVFADAYARRWQESPDGPAANGYDAVTLVVAAIRRAGLNRVRIREAVRASAPWEGAGGTVRWDALGRNQRPLVLGRWTQGHLMTWHTTVQE